jgi:hypothetical protein
MRVVIGVPLPLPVDGEHRSRGGRAPDRTRGGGGATCVTTRSHLRKRARRCGGGCREARLAGSDPRLLIPPRRGRSFPGSLTLYERCGTDSALTVVGRQTLKPETEGLAMLSGYPSRPRACSSVDRASASGARPLERCGHPSGTPSETDGVLRSNVSAPWGRNDQSGPSRTQPRWTVAWIR